MKVRLMGDVRYFVAVGPILLGKSDVHIDGSKRFHDQFCGLVFAGTEVDLMDPVKKSYDHGDKMAIPFQFNGKEYFFLKKEILGEYREVRPGEPDSKIPVSEEKEWIIKAIPMIQRLRRELHETHGNCLSVGATPEVCYICGTGVEELIKKGKRLTPEQVPF